MGPGMIGAQTLGATIRDVAAAEVQTAEEPEMALDGGDPAVRDAAAPGRRLTLGVWRAISHSYFYSDEWTMADGNKYKE